MKIEFSLRDTPANLITVNNVVAYTQTNKECIIVQESGVWGTIQESEIEDFTVFGLGQA